MTRHFSRRKLLLAGGALSAAALGDVFLLEPNWLDVTRHAVPVPKLPHSLEGFRIAHLTDTHFKGVGRLERRIIGAIGELSPQLVVLTGDAVDSARNLPVLEQVSAELRRLGAPLIATLGNWEHWSQLPREGLLSAYRKSGARLLVNESMRVDGVDVVATDDGLSGRPDWSQSLAAATGEVRLLLTHSPALVDRAPELPRFQLCLAGHTHGGQARLGPWAPMVPPGSGRFVKGDYETKLGPLYVSRGIGTSVVPGRLMCRPELAIFELTRA